MRTVDPSIAGKMILPRVASLQLTARKQKLTFVASTVSDGLGLSDPSRTVDADNCGDGMMRVTIHPTTKVLCTQYVPDVDTDGFYPDWDVSGDALKTGSRPGIGGDKLWYQLASGLVYYKTVSDVGSISDHVFVTSTLTSRVCSFAPVEGGAYLQYLDGSWLAIAFLSDAGVLTPWVGRIYGDIQTANFIDAATVDGVDYIYTMDRNAGRIIEISRSGEVWSASRYVIPIDVIDNVAGMTLAYVTVIDNHVVLTARLVKSSDVDPVAMDIVTFGPTTFSVGRYSFITEENVGGKLLLITDSLFYVGLNKVMKSPATVLYGYDNPALKTVTDDIISMEFGDQEMGMSNADLTLAHDVNGIEEGDEITIDLLYDGVATQLSKLIVSEISTAGSVDDLALRIAGNSISAELLTMHVPQQSYYIPSQDKVSSHPSDLTNLIRASGTFAGLTETPLTASSLNETSVLYSVGQASKSGLMRAKFQHPAGDYSPVYGVGVNYYRESFYDVATRLGIPQTEVNQGQLQDNGIVALWSKFEHAGTPGIALYDWVGGQLQLLTSVSLDIADDVWNWMEISFLDGLLNVSYRLDADAEWQTVISTVYTNGTTLPWKRETFGRGCIYIKNNTTSSTGYGFYSNDMVIPVEEIALFPTSDTVVIDSEQITYNGKSADFTATAELTVGVASSFRPVSGESFVGTELVIEGADGVNPDGYYIGAALLMTSGTGRSAKITGYDAIAPQKWVPNAHVITYPDTWQDHIGNTHYGSWTASNMRRVFVEGDIASTLEPGSKVTITPALTVTKRGFNSTSATTHGAVIVSLYRDLSVMVDWFDSFTGEVDQCLEDVLTYIACDAGCEKPIYKSKFSGDVVATDVWEGSALLAESENFIADITIPSLTDGQGIGTVWGTTEDTFGAVVSGGPGLTAGYMLTLDMVGADHLITFHKAVLGVWAPVETVTLGYVPSGNFRISVQGSTVSAWVQGRLAVSFYDGTYVDGSYMAFISRTAKTFTARIPELVDYYQTFVMDARTSGSAVFQQTISDRGILFSDDQNGSLRVYREKTDAGLCPDIIYNYEELKSNMSVTWTRTEGISIVEEADFDAMREYGIIYRVNNARFANSSVDTRRAGSNYRDLGQSRSSEYTIETALYPLYQVGDTVEFAFLDGNKIIDIKTIKMGVGVRGENISCTMNIRGYLHG